MSDNIRLRQWGLLTVVIAFVLAIAFGVAWFATQDKPEKKVMKTETLLVIPQISEKL